MRKVVDYGTRPLRGRLFRLRGPRRRGKPWMRSPRRGWGRAGRRSRPACARPAGENRSQCAAHAARAVWLRRWPSRVPLEAIAERLGSDDPFVAQAARVAASSIAEPDFQQLAASVTAAPATSPRIGAELLLIRRQRGERPTLEELGALLALPDPQSRFVALQWIAETDRVECRPLVEQFLRVSGSPKVRAKQRRAGPVSDDILVSGSSRKRREGVEAARREASAAG